ncbi:DNA primase [Candidatus Gottesmanbacteria bacterium]|nr:DNA primase [Candidatus Gottesmanbacteria bacterium]
MSDIDEVKSRLNIVDIIGSRVALKKAGRHFKALCPFHNEKTPSFIVSPERQSWHCFGCAKGGSVIDFVMEYEHVDFLEALETLAEKAGVKLERRSSDTPEAKLKTRLYEVNHLTSEFYHYLLTKHALGAKARDYLKDRGVTEKSIKTFSLGYSANSWDGLLKFLQRKGYEKKLLEQAGLMVSSARGGYDRFRGRVMFTLKDHRGNVVGFSGRLLDPEAKEAKYINTSETAVYNKSSLLYGLDITKEAIQKEQEAIIMEGEFDVISSFQAGIGNAVAIKGSALTEGHVHLLRRFAERILFALDSDVAGDSASRRGIEIADRAGLDMKVVILPTGKDPDEEARQHPGLLKKAITEAIPIYDYFISSSQRRFDVTTAFGKKKASDELLPIFAKIDNPIVQNHYVKKFSDILGVDVAVVMESMKKVRKQPLQQSVGSQIQPVQATKTGDENLTMYLLALLLQGDTSQLYEEFKELEIVFDIPYEPVKKIVLALDGFLKDHTKFFIKDFASFLPQELVPTLDKAYLWDVSHTLSDRERFAREWYRTLVAFRRQILKKKLFDLSKLLHQEGGKLSEDAIQKRIRDVSGQLKKLENSS